MAITMHQVVGAADAVAGTTQTVAYTMINGTSGQSRKLIVSVAATNRTCPAASGIIYNSVAATRRTHIVTGGPAGSVTAASYEWDDTNLPADTSSHNIVIDYGASSDGTCFIIRELSGVVQGALAANAIEIDASADPGTLALTTTVGSSQVYLSHFMVENRTYSSLPSGVDLTIDVSAAGYNKRRAHALSGPGSPGLTTHSWDLSAGASQVMMGYEVLPSAAASSIAAISSGYHQRGIR